MLDKEPLLADGTLVSKTMLHSGKINYKYQYQYRVQFTSLPTGDHDRIVQCSRYLMNKEERQAGIVSEKVSACLKTP